MQFFQENFKKSVRYLKKSRSPYLAYNKDSKALLIEAFRAYCSTYKECEIDRLHTDNPAWGARQMSSQLKMRGHEVGRRKAVSA